MSNCNRCARVINHDVEFIGTKGGTHNSADAKLYSQPFVPLRQASLREHAFTAIKLTCLVSVVAHSPDVPVPAAAPLEESLKQNENLQCGASWEAQVAFPLAMFFQLPTFVNQTKI